MWYKRWYEVITTPYVGVRRPDSNVLPGLVRRFLYFWLDGGTRVCCWGRGIW